MSDPKTAIGAENSSSTDIMEYRYGELLLNVAECYAAQGKAECLTYLGKVRSRVGILSTDNYGLGSISGRYELIKAVLTERQIELAYEGKRPWDLKRWLLFEGGAGFDPILVADIIPEQAHTTRNLLGERDGKSMMVRTAVLTIPVQIMF